MRATLLLGAVPDDAHTRCVAKVLTSALEERACATEAIDLAELDIAPCLGCFGCWVKTPGICVIDDVGRDVARKAIQCDLLAYVTPITFGGYSYELKKAVDRLIPLVTPFFKLVDGEIHHQKRYVRYPSLIGVGTVKKPDGEAERIFRTLIERNAINFHSPGRGACALPEEGAKQAIEGTIRGLLDAVEVAR